MRKELEELLNKENIENHELNMILSYVKDEPIFFDIDKRLLSLGEILNYKNELNCELNIIPLIDNYDNDYLVYNIGEKQFQMLDISSDNFWNKLESICDYLSLLETKIMVDEILNKSENKLYPLGLTIETIKKVSNYFEQNFQCPLPTGYINFLHQMNGFSDDGHSIFCCYNEDIQNNFPKYSNLDLVTFNKNFHENTDISDYIMLGKSSINYIGYIKNKKRFVIMTNGTMQHLGEFDSFKELVTAFMKF